MNNIKIFNDDFFNILPNIKDKVDLVLVDLPYNQTHCQWDQEEIDLKKMWKSLKNCCHSQTIYIFFCTTKFGYKLIESNKKWFRYDLVWEKSNCLGFLNCNKMPLRNFEMIYIFSDPINYDYNDIQNIRNLDLRNYFEKVLKFINKPKKKIINDIGQCVDHCLRFSSSQFSLPTEETYNKLIEIYKINDMKDFINYKDLQSQWTKPPKKKTTTYNPQKTKGKPYKVKEHSLKYNSVYGADKVGLHENKTGDRHPKSIIKFNNSLNGYHPTEKPVELLEWLIKTYSNKNDIVLDHTMGSGSTGVACINTNRKFIGIEKDLNFFNIAKERMNIKY